MARRSPSFPWNRRPRIWCPPMDRRSLARGWIAGRVRGGGVARTLGEKNVCFGVRGGTPWRKGCVKCPGHLLRKMKKTNAGRKHPEKKTQKNYCSSASCKRPEQMRFHESPGSKKTLSFREIAGRLKKKEYREVSWESPGASSGSNKIMPWNFSQTKKCKKTEYSGTPTTGKNVPLGDPLTIEKPRKTQEEQNTHTGTFESLKILENTIFTTIVVFREKPVAEFWEERRMESLGRFLHRPGETVLKGVWRALARDGRESREVQQSTTIRRFHGTPRVAFVVVQVLPFRCRITAQGSAV